MQPEQSPYQPYPTNQPTYISINKLNVSGTNSQVKLTFNGTTFATIQGAGIIPLTPVEGANTLQIEIKSDSMTEPAVGYDITLFLPDGTRQNWSEPNIKGPIFIPVSFMCYNRRPNPSPYPGPWPPAPMPAPSYCCTPIMPWTAWFCAWTNLFNPGSTYAPGNCNNAYYQPPGPCN